MKIIPDHSAGKAEALGHTFADPYLLDLALTHSSHANEHGQPAAHNERLEFLGDAVLELCVSRELFHRFPGLREGELTRLRSHLVNESTLAWLARQYGLDQTVRLGRGEEMQGGRRRDAILADCLEAVLAAIYEDAGPQAAALAVGEIYAGFWQLAEDVVNDSGRPDSVQPDSGKFTVDRLFAWPPADASNTDPGKTANEKRAKATCRGGDSPKNRLQELLVRKFGSFPVYLRTGAEGPEHARTFTVELRLPDGRSILAHGSSCKRAEQDAALKALALYGHDNSGIPGH